MYLDHLPLGQARVARHEGQIGAVIAAVQGRYLHDAAGIFDFSGVEGEVAKGRGDVVESGLERVVVNECGPVSGHHFDHAVDVRPLDCGNRSVDDGVYVGGYLVAVLHHDGEIARGHEYRLVVRGHF